MHPETMIDILKNKKYNAEKCHKGNEPNIVFKNSFIIIFIQNVHRVIQDVNLFKKETLQITGFLITNKIKLLYLSIYHSQYFIF